MKESEIARDIASYKSLLKTSEDLRDWEACVVGHESLQHLYRLRVLNELRDKQEGKKI